MGGVTLMLRSLVFGMAALGWAGTAQADPAYLIDTHAHVDPLVSMAGGVNAALSAMDRYRVRATVLMSPPQAEHRANAYEADALLFAMTAHPGKIAVNGGGLSVNSLLHETKPDTVDQAVKDRLKAEAARIKSLGLAGFGELAVHHLSLKGMGPNHPYESIPGDHPLLMALADVAAEHNMPIDLHLDLIPEDMPMPERPIFNKQNPALLKSNMAGLERLLAHNRAAKIIWAHAGTDPLGTRTPAIQHALLERNPNLYMSLRVSRTGAPSFLALDDNKNLKPEWRKLLTDFSDRFVLGSDIFYGGSGRGVEIDDAMGNYWRLLCQLPPEAADAIAYKNAERLYRLKPPPTDEAQPGGGCAKFGGK